MPRFSRLRWLNWLSIDTVAVAVAWFSALAVYFGEPIHSWALLVLGLSVWLTYTADRLYDIRDRTPESILSQRHRFSYKYAGPIWKIWWALLAIDLCLAFVFLDPGSLKRGFYLLGLCLIYTGANQLLSKLFFPKELLVAILFTAGIFVFLAPPYPLMAVTIIAVICLLNCLSIGHHEASIDQAFGIHSLATWFVPKLAHTSYALCISLTILTTNHTLRNLLVLTLLLQWLIYTLQKHFHPEDYRVYADLALLTGPIIFLGFPVYNPL